MNVNTTEYKAPNVGVTVNIFLAGAIDNGAASLWQGTVIQDVTNAINQRIDPQVSGDLNLNFFNPRRENWTDLDPETLSQQIKWELNNIKNSDIVIVYFESTSLAPITLLELGLGLGNSKHYVIIHCPEDFYRYANVQITAEMHGVPVHTIYSEFVESVCNAVVDKCIRDNNELFKNHSV